MNILFSGQPPVEGLLAAIGPIGRAFILLYIIPRRRIPL